VTDFSTVLSLFATSAAAGAIATYGLDNVRQRLSARSEAKMLAKELEAAVLQSNDITELGEYLYNNIGATRVSNYINDGVVRERVKQALGSVLTFLGTEEDQITLEEAEEAGGAAGRLPLTSEDYAKEFLPADETMRKALEEIRFGEVWNGLARIRRYVETRLLEIAPDDIRTAKLPLGRLLNILIRRGLISPLIAEKLQYPIKVANAGIHGADIDRDQAEEAWRLAASALDELASTVSPDTDQGP
jgi:hypothetical protein